MEKFFNSLEEIVQRSECKRTRTHSICSQNRRPVDCPVDRHAQHSAQQQFGRPSDRATARATFLLRVCRPTDWHEPSFCLGWPVDRRKGRSTGTVDRQSDLLVLL